MPDTLRIFISHKMPADSSLAQEVSQKLGLFGADRIKVVHAGQFPSGDTWRSSIERELDEAHWLILLHTDRDSDWNFCMFECGYFRARMKSVPSARLIPMCQDIKYVSDAISEFNAVQVDGASVCKLLEDIYREEPWKLSPKLSTGQLQETAEDIVELYEGSQRVEENFEVVTNVTLELGLSDENKAVLARQRIPPDTSVTGSANWQQLFGRLPNSSGWLWPALIEKWPFSDIYEYLIASMINDALESSQPKGTLLRSPDQHELFRLTLQRYEVLKNKKYRFYFIAAPLDLPFDLPLGPRHETIETVLYHLVNLTWYFRRRVVDQLYNRVTEVMSMLVPEPKIVERLYKDLGQELKQIRAQSIIRGIDNSLVLQRALGPENPEAQALVSRGAEYDDLERKIFEAFPRGPEGLRQVTENLYGMAKMNYDWYKKVSTGYSQLAQALQTSEAPPTQKVPNNSKSGLQALSPENLR